MILGDHLEQLCRSTTQVLWLVAPFIKEATLNRLLGLVSPEVKVNCVTRWRPEEIQAGVSDLNVWMLIRERPNSVLWLRSDLHAKYYRGDQSALVGSANLTNTALGWLPQPNLELLIDSEPLLVFEQTLLAGSIVVDDSLYEHVKQLVAQLPVPTRVLLEPDTSLEDEITPQSVDAWLPLLRQPKSLYIAYKGNWDRLGTGSRIVAFSDLQILHIPVGLSKEQFEIYVGIQLLQMPIIRQVDQFVEIPQRFGAVRDYLKTLPCANQNSFDANNAWQTLMRWLLNFLPTRYELLVPRHSEIFCRKT
jgi:hypothetical protein